MRPLFIKTTFKVILYIRNLKCALLTHDFRLHYIHLVFSLCQLKYKWILSKKKTVLIASFQDFWCTKIDNHLICFEKYVFKSLIIPYTQHEFLALNTHLSSFLNNQMLIYTFNSKILTKYIKRRYVLLFFMKSSYLSYRMQ